MAHLIGYFDESRAELPEHGESIVAVAGYFGASELLDGEAANRWGAAAQTGPRRIKEFKTSHCAQGVGEFKGWTKKERSDLFKAVIGSLEDFWNIPYGGFGAAVEIPRVLDRQQRADYMRFAQVWCVGVVVGMIRESLPSALARQGLLGTVTRVQIVFDEQRELRRLMSGMYEAHWRELSPVMKQVFDPQPTFENSMTTPMLQAADLLAYETQKEIRSRLYEPDRPVRQSLARMVAARPHVASYMNDGLVRGMHQAYAQDLADSEYPQSLPLYDATGVTR